MLKSLIFTTLVFLNSAAVAGTYQRAQEEARKTEQAAMQPQRTQPCLWQLPGYWEVYNLDRIVSIRVRNENRGNKLLPRYTTVINFGHGNWGGYAELEHPSEAYTDPGFYISKILAKLKECGQ